jgi:ankyrin repeat protein
MNVGVIPTTPNGAATRSASIGSHSTQERQQPYTQLQAGNPTTASSVSQHSKLTSFLANRKWDEAIQLLNTNEGRVMTNERDRHGRYPIHQALFLEAPPSLIKALIKANNTHAMLTSSDGSLPLHMALEPHPAVAADFVPNDEVFSVVFTGFEEAAKQRNPQQKLPLELALRHVASDHIVFSLIDVYPGAVKELHREQGDIIRFAIENNGSVDASMRFLEILGDDLDRNVRDAVESSFRRLRYALEMEVDDDMVMALLAKPHAKVLNTKNESLLQVALRNKYSEMVVLALLAACPIASKCPDSLGYLPLHRALVHKASDEVILSLVKEFPEAAMAAIQNKSGGPDLMPLTVALQTKRSGPVVQALLNVQVDAVSCVDENGDMPLHQAIKLGAPAGSVEAILYSWEDAAKAKDKNGYLPLHLSIKHSAPGDTIVKILNCYPEACRQIDKSGDLPLHQAINFSTGTNAIMAILKAWDVAVMLKNKTTDMLPLHYSVMRATEPEVIETLLKVYPHALAVTAVNDQGRPYKPSDMASHVLHQESIRMVMKPVAYWEREAAGEVQKDVETRTFEALTAVVDELESKVRNGAEREQLLLEKIKSLEGRLKTLAVQTNGTHDLLDA